MHPLTRPSFARAARVAIIPATIALLGLQAAPLNAATPAAAPQVLLAITNSESMDGTTAGAIMVGSGSLGSSMSLLLNSSSPQQYTVPSGFTPPVQAASGGLANYTANCLTNSAYKCDNGPSRLNMTKAAIKSVLNSYGATINFGIYTYSTSGTSLYTTWVYQMSPTSGAFGLTNTSSSNTVPNPCYNYQTLPNTNTVYSNCSSIAGQLGGASALNSNLYMTVSTSSDNPQVNDVLYASGLSPVFLDYGQVSPANPYTYYSLSTYNNNPGSYSESYPNVTPSGNAKTTTPTNAGFVPYSPQVMYIQRGFGYGGSQSATTGTAFVPMGTDPTTTAGAQTFANALNPETNNASTGEIKAVAGQSAIAGLLAGAKTYMGNITKASCQSQYVVLMTDGLPTLDLAGKTWPPLGTITGNAYNLTATFDSTGAFVSSNSQAVTDAMTSVTALANAGVKVYVIGLGAGVDKNTNPIAYNLLQAMAIAGGTANFFPANDPTSLSNAFQTIVAQIYASSSIAAPLVPKTVQSGSAYEYTATTTTPSAGHVTAYPVDSSGNPNGGPAWTTDNTMTVQDRTNKLRGGTGLTLLTSLTDAAFGLPTPRATCVPDGATVTNYTINPSATGLACSAATYLGSRAANVLLGAFTMENQELFLGPPSSGLLTQKSGYVTWARSHATRPTSVLFTSSDGFLYSIDATTGALKWGWINTYNLTQLQNYSTFQSTGPTNGDFSVVDSYDGTSWASYIVGSMNSGGERYSLKLDDNGIPSAVVYDMYPGSSGNTPAGTTAGDATAATGNAPLRQPPVIAYFGSGGTTAYTIYVVTNGSTSTLWETNVTSGASTSAVLPFTVSSALFIDSASNQLWMGTTTGQIWYTTLGGSGASTDVAGLHQAGTTVNPATGAAVSNVQWVSYFRANGIPYFYATNAGQITLFGASSTGWVPLWTATTAVNYTYTPPVPANGSSPAVPGRWVQVTSSANLLTANAVISDMPLVVGRLLVVPAFVAGTGCSLGTGYYDYFALADGTFPTSALVDAGLGSITADQQIGTGAAFTPSITITGNGYDLNRGSQNCTTLCGLDHGNNRLTNTSVSWRQH